MILDGMSYNGHLIGKIYVFLPYMYYVMYATE